MVTPRCVAADFDDTLAHYTDGLLRLISVFTSQGVPESIVRETISGLSATGFSLETWLRALSQSGYQFMGLAEDIEREFTHALRNSLAPYPDTLSFAQKCRASHDVPLVVVTFGNEEFQRRKLGIVGLPYDEVRVTTEHGKKVHEIMKLGVRYGWPVWMVDDNPLELDAVRAAMLGPDLVRTILMQRPDGPKRPVPQYDHETITSFAELMFDGSDKE